MIYLKLKIKIKNLISDDLLLPNLYSYLIINKLTKYHNREETIDHLSKVARRFLNENNIKVHNMSFADSMEYRHKYFLTIQKACDERDTEFLLAYENPMH